MEKEGFGSKGETAGRVVCACGTTIYKKSEDNGKLTETAPVRNRQIGVCDY